MAGQVSAFLLSSFASIEFSSSTIVRALAYVRSEARRRREGSPSLQQGIAQTQALCCCCNKVRCQHAPFTFRQRKENKEREVSSSCAPALLPSRLSLSPSFALFEPHLVRSQFVSSLTSTCVYHLYSRVNLYKNSVSSSSRVFCLSVALPCCSEVPLLCSLPDDG